MILLRKFALLLAVLAGVLLFLRRLFGGREDTDWARIAKPGKSVDVDGVGLHYVEAGSGPAVLMVHGLGGHTFSFRHTIPGLAPQFRAIALDLKGYGYSERATHGPYSQDEQARLIVRLMDVLGIDKATLVGHSLGGAIVMRVASTYPERVERLVLVASVSGERFPVLPLAPLLLRPLLPLLARLIAWRLLSRAVARSSLITPERRRAYTEPLRIRGTMDGLYRMIRDHRHDPPIDFRAVRQPVLILWGAEERVLPGWTLSRLRRRFPGAPLVTVERAGHLLLEEQPEACNSAIRRFLEKPAKEVPAAARRTA